MPWFITTTTTTTRGSAEDLDSQSSAERPSLDIRDKKTFGFYEKYYEARKAISENRGHMHADNHCYLVLEHIEEGIPPQVGHVEWFDWDISSYQWLRLKQQPACVSIFDAWALE